MKFNNTTQIPIGIAVWLVNDNYDYINTPNYISTTRLLAPIRQTILNQRVSKSNQSIDLEELIASSIGSSIHDSIESAWRNNYRKNLKLLGYPDSMIDKVVIDPEPEELKPDSFPIYLEQRTVKELGEYVIGGKYDMVLEGIVHDHKSTSTYTWITGGRDEEHKLQGSIYRWLNPDKITEDFIRIHYIFTNWVKSYSLTDTKYPPRKVMIKDIPLLSIEETERWIKSRLNQIKKYQSLPDSEIPECSSEELWRDPPKYKYYSDPTKTAGRSTKNFDDIHEAITYKKEKNNVGIILTVLGEAKRCQFCSAAPICEQYKRLTSGT